jgi:hypothetical protein
MNDDQKARLLADAGQRIKILAADASTHAEANVSPVPPGEFFYCRVILYQTPLQKRADKRYLNCTLLNEGIL